MCLKDLRKNKSSAIMMHTTKEGSGFKTTVFIPSEPEALEVTIRPGTEMKLEMATRSPLQIANTGNGGTF